MKTVEMNIEKEKKNKKTYLACSIIFIYAGVLEIIAAYIGKSLLTVCAGIFFICLSIICFYKWEKID